VKNFVLVVGVLFDLKLKEFRIGVI